MVAASSASAGGFKALSEPQSHRGISRNIETKNRLGVYVNRRLGGPYYGFSVGTVEPIGVTNP